MRLLIDLFLAAVIAVVAGVGSAWWVIDRGFLFGAVTAGAWTAWPLAGSPAADPYAEAMLARSGEVPLGAGEGIAFTAAADSAGRRLSGACTYAVSGQTPAARLWTLTAYDGDGHLMENPALRTTFHSREILRHDDGGFVVSVGASARPGNWLPVGPVKEFRLTLRLYDTPLTTGLQAAAVVMPRIERVSCP